eukprot:2753115-Prymnesium_polylepis.1
MPPELRSQITRYTSVALLVRWPRRRRGDNDFGGVSPNPSGADKARCGTSPAAGAEWAVPVQPPLRRSPDGSQASSKPPQRVGARRGV